MRTQYVCKICSKEFPYKIKLLHKHLRQHKKSELVPYVAWWVKVI